MTLYEKINDAISIAILCGGKSSRFGDRPKITYKINDKFMFQILYDKLQSFTDDIFFQGSIKIENTIQEHVEIMNFENYRFIPDLIEDKGPLGGIYSALTHAKHPKLFVVAVDLPFVDGTILLELMKYLECQIIVPKWSNGFYEPLCAIYSRDRDITGLIEKRLARNKLGVSRLFELENEIKLKFVNIDELIEQGWIGKDCFKNVNTVKDLIR